MMRQVLVPLWAIICVAGAYLLFLAWMTYVTIRLELLKRRWAREDAERIKARRDRRAENQKGEIRGRAF